MVEREAVSIEDYAALARQCRTVNQFNRLHIDLDRHLAPAELATLANEAAATNLPAESLGWLERTIAMAPDLATAPQAFRRQALAEQLTLYSDPRQPATAKSLLLAFAGNARKLMIATSVFLQAFDASAWDVVVLRKQARDRPHITGIDGIAPDLPGVLDYVLRTLSAHRYRRICTIGTSSGGYPAVLAACILRAARGVAVGGRAPPSEAAVVPPNEATDLRIVFSELCEPDRRAAIALQRLLGGTLQPLAGQKKHNAFLPLVQRGALAAFMSGLFSQTAIDVDEIAKAMTGGATG